MTDTVRLHVDGDRIVLDVLTVAGSADTGKLDAGSWQDVSRLLRHEPPTPSELEAAIAAIEDALMPALRRLPASRRLVASTALLADIAAAAGSAKAALETATVEMLFNRLADVAHGTPAARLGIPVDRAFAARLLLLREVLHHGGFGAVEPCDDDPPAAGNA